MNMQDLPRISESCSHFWGSLPEQLTCLLTYPCVVTILGLCDNIVYQTALKELTFFYKPETSEIEVVLFVSPSVCHIEVCNLVI